MLVSKSLLILSSCLFGLTLAEFGDSLLADDFSGFKLFQVKPKNDQERELLGRMDDFYPEDVVDFWRDPKEDIVEFLVHGDLAEDLTLVLDEANITSRIKIDDFQMVVDEERRKIADAEGEYKFREGDAPTFRSAFNLFNYHNLEEIEKFITQFGAAFPDQVDVTNLQSTYEGRQIKLVHVSLDITQKTSRPAIFMDCGIHAREWISPAFCIYALDRLIDQGSSGLLRHFDIYMIPVANPDGYKHTWSSGRTRMWRKNRRPASRLLFRNLETKQFWPSQQGGLPGGYPGQTGFSGNFPTGNMPQFPGGGASNSKCWGTDPNRNFDIRHGTVGASNNPCQDTYHGESAFSDAESQAIRDGLKQVLVDHNEKVVYVSVHAYSQLWMFPNGYSKALSEHHLDLKRVASKAVKALKNEHGVTYKSGPIAEIIYEASGSSVDWAHAKLGIKYAYALELRDDGTHGFILPVNEIQPTVEETFAGIVGMADEIYNEFEGKASSSFGSNQNNGLVDVLVYKGPTKRVYNEDDLPQKSPFFSEDW